MQLKIRTPKDDFFDSAMNALPYAINNLPNGGLKDSLYELYKLGQFIRITEEDNVNPVPPLDTTDMRQD